MKTDYHLVDLIKILREKHGNLLKNKLKPFVDALRKELNFPTISVSTIGKVIKRKQLFYDKSVQVISQKRTYGIIQIIANISVSGTG